MHALKFSQSNVDGFPFPVHSPLWENVQFRAMWPLHHAKGGAISAMITYTLQLVFERVNLPASNSSKITVAGNFKLKIMFTT